MVPALTLIYGAWIVGLAFWAAASIASKRTMRRQSTGSELGQGAIAGAGFVMLFNSQINLGPLEWRLIPNAPIPIYIGFAATVLGLGVMAWSRIVLGRNWSAAVTIKKDHELVSSGPYAIVRHPLYSGVLLAMLGTAVSLGKIREFVAFLLTFGGWWLKSRTEERFMLAVRWSLPTVSTASEGSHSLLAVKAVTSNQHSADQGAAYTFQ
jgi:protein-S-isoprenylcysteine O-methyltransferase Ste14